MSLLYITIVVICLLIIIIYKYFFNAYNKFILIFDKLKQRFLLLMKNFHFQVFIDFCL